MPATVLQPVPSYNWEYVNNDHFEKSQIKATKCTIDPLAGEFKAYAH